MVEPEIDRDPWVAESAVIAVPSEYSEDEIKAVVVLLSGRKVDPLELIRYLELKLSHFMIPRYIEIVEALRKTPTEKAIK